jgi:hypothetical protein
MLPQSHLVVPGLPKSANVFIQRTLELTLGCHFVRFVTPSQNIIPEKFDEFLACEHAVGGEHLLANEHNLGLLAAQNVHKVALLIRDPRDALISWWKHFHRSDMKARANELISGGFLPQGYYELEPQQQLRQHIERDYSFFQNWITDWTKVAESSSGPECHVLRYEEFVADQRRSVHRLLTFFGHDVDPVFPDTQGARDAGIHTETHFRRGRVGSHKDEAAPELIALLNERLSTDLAARFD